MLCRARYAGLLLLLLFFSLAAGCISFGPAPSRTEGGLSSAQTNVSPIHDVTSRNAPKVSLDDAIGALRAASQEGIDTTGMNITRIWGYGVDSSGLATTWVLGMRGGGNTELLSYSGGEWKVVDLPLTLPDEEVNLTEIVSPQELFQRNLGTIVREMNRLNLGEANSLTLDEHTYQIFLQSASGSSTLSFNAETGELISSP